MTIPTEAGICFAFMRHMPDRLRYVGKRRTLRRNRSASRLGGILTDVSAGADTRATPLPYSKRRIRIVGVDIYDDPRKGV